MFSEVQIKAKAWLVVEVTNLVLLPEKREVDKIFLIGSYASGKATEWSDIDFLIQLKQDTAFNKAKQLYPTWEQIRDIHKRLDTNRIHVIFGTEEAAKSLHQKHKFEKKNYSYKLLDLGGLHASTHTANA